MSTKKSKYKTRSRKKSEELAAEKKLSQERYAELVERFNMGEFGDYRHLSMGEYFKILFERKGQLRLQERGREHYRDGHYNALIRKVSKGGKESHRWWVVTDTLEGIEQYEKVKFAIVSPVTYIGKTRSLYRREEDENGDESVDYNKIGNARYLFGVAVDIDHVFPKNVKFLVREIKEGRLPEPTMIITSGHGLHLYYCFVEPIYITIGNLELLNMVKFGVTAMLWRYNGTTQQRKVEMHNIGQGYRFPGTQTKFDRIVLGWSKGDVPRYYTLHELYGYVREWKKIRPELFDNARVLSDATIKFLETGSKKNTLTYRELKELEKDLRLPAHWSLKTAISKFGEEWWEKVQKNEERYGKGKGSIDWKNYSVKFYNWWLKKLQFSGEVSIGHRYWCIYTLAAWAFNCKIPFAQLQRDAYALLESFNALLDDDDKHVPFTVRDCNAALKIYKERKAQENPRPIRLGRETTQRITGIKIASNKRSYNSRLVHGKLAIDMRKQYSEETGLDWKDSITGRKPKDKIVAEWRELHPDGTQYACAKDLQIDKKTVRKWWNCTAEDARIVDGYDKQADKKPSELHELGADVNYGYIADEQIAAAVMQHTEGYEFQDAETIRKTGGELTDAINYGALNVEVLMRSMGVPEFMIPMMKAEFERQMQSPEFWEMYKKARPDVDMSAWPPEARQAYEAAVSEHMKKK